jgi:hypothetical protein
MSALNEFGRRVGEAPVWLRKARFVRRAYGMTAHLLSGLRFGGALDDGIVDYRGRGPEPVHRAIPSGVVA